MIDLVAITDGIATALVPTELTIYPRPVGNWSSGCIIVRPGEPFVEYDRSFGANGLASVNFDLEVHLPLGADTDNAYRAMYRLCGESNDSTAIFNILRDDPTLGGAVSDAYAGRVSAPVEQGSELVATFGLSVMERKG